MPDASAPHAPLADLTAAEQRVRDRDIETRAGWPTSHEMIAQLREALGLFVGAMSISPQQAWEEALAEARRLREAAGG